MAQYVTDNEERGPRRQLFLTLFFVALAITLRILPPDGQQRVAAAFSNTVLLPFVLVQKGLADSRVHAQTTEELQARLDSLEVRLSNQRVLVEENRHLREMLALGPRLGARYVAADVIRSGTSMSESSFVLDVGSAAGVREDVTVMTGAGLVGMVSTVQRDRAQAMDWTHPNFRVSGMTQDGSAFGMVRAARADFREADRLRLDGVPFQQELVVGTRIVTSGLGRVHPRGIPIGTVVEEADVEAGAGWQRSYWLTPVVMPGEATHVLVLIEAFDSLPDLTPVWAGESPPSPDSIGGGRP